MTKRSSQNSLEPALSHADPSTPISYISRSPRPGVICPNGSSQLIRALATNRLDIQPMLEIRISRIEAPCLTLRFEYGSELIG